MPNYGVGPAGLPFHRFGDGDRPLVFIPGVMDPLGWNDPGRPGAELLARYYFRSFRNFDVWVLSRPPGLDADTSVSEIAEHYGEALATIGPAHVVGFSFGGFIAAELAAAWPDRIDRLVLAMSGPRYGEYGQQVLDRWASLGDARRWAEIHRSYAETVYSGFRGWLVPTLYRLGSPLLPTPVVSTDVARTMQLAREYRGARTLEEVDTSTLVLAGTRDVMVPESLIRSGATRLSDVTVASLPGGHAAYEECRTAFATTVGNFLA